MLGKRADCRASNTTRARVVSAAQKLGYRPSRMAHALHGKGTMTVALITGFQAVDIWMRAMSGFEGSARDRGYMVLTAATQNSAELEERVISDIMDRHVDAFAVYPTADGKHERLKGLVRGGFPVVTFDASGRMPFAVDDVSIDQFQGGRLQAHHLAEVGCRRICMITPAERCYVNDLKTAGLEAGAKEAGIEVVTRFELKHPWDDLSDRHPNAYDETLALMRENAGKFDSIAAQGDVMAMLAIRALHELNVRVPDDIAIIGFNDILTAGLMTPSLTTIADPAEEMGRSAMDLLLERLSGVRTGDQMRQIKIQPRLVVRESTRRRKN